MKNISDVLTRSNHLGAFNPFTFTDKSGNLHFSEFMEDTISSYPQKLTINISSAICVLNKNYMLGDATIVNGISRIPWMAYPDKNNSKWLYHDIPAHKNNIETVEQVAKNLFDLLCEEIIEYVKEKKRIGVLLSGGMDSRILTGCLDYLIKNKIITIDKVVAFTWGLDGSRDVEYSKRIAKSLNWEWNHYTVDSNDLWENYRIAGERGCEYAGIHLHAMSKIADDCALVDVFLAGSYGDSIGRGEYSGRRVSGLKPIQSGIKNTDGLLSNRLYAESKNKIEQEVKKYHLLFPKKEEYMANELDYQLHYMRRMLNPCMEVINDKKPLYQIFTNPKVFGYIWGLDLSIRNNDIYYNILEIFPSEISDVPWARTGKRYGHDEDVKDNFTKKHHNYETIIQKDHLDKIQKFINENKDYLPYFNLNAINSILNDIRKYPYGNFDFLEKITWIVSFIYFIKKYKGYIDFEKDINTNSLGGVVMAKINYFFHTRGRALKRMIK